MNPDFSNHRRTWRKNFAASGRGTRSNAATGKKHHSCLGTELDHEDALATRMPEAELASGMNNEVVEWNGAAEREAQKAIAVMPHVKVTLNEAAQNRDGTVSTAKEIRMVSPGAPNPYDQFQTRRG